MLFPANLLTSTKKTKSKPGERTTKIYNFSLLQHKITMHQEHKNTITQDKLKQLQMPRFGHLLQPLAWKQSGPILKEKVNKEVDK